MTSLPANQQTPMMKQFVSIKESQPDAILFFRLGDFYEMFFDDAIKAAKLLDLTLTGRGKDEQRVPMCGVPYHAAENYINKLIEKGLKVAICEQVEDASSSKGITKREIVKVVTPATHLSDQHLVQHDNLYLTAIFPLPDGQSYAISVVDSTTGEFKCGILNSEATLYQTLARLQPKECLIPLGFSLNYDCLTSFFNPLPPK